VSFLEANRARFVQASSVCSEEEDEGALNFARKYQSLLLTLCSNYEVLFVSEATL
jgi:hypothetical protein